MSKLNSQIPYPFVSVIVPVYNDSQRIGKCIEALQNQTYPHEKYEVIVVDNGSTDDTCTIIRKYLVKLLTEDKIKSSYAGRNKGIRNSRGEVIALTDSDCIPAPDWIEKGVARLLQVPECGLVAGRINIFFKKPDKPNAIGLYDSIMGFNQKGDIEQLRFGSTANVFTFKKVFDHVGLFNDKLKSGGDNEWGKRVFGSNYKQTYAADVCVAHPARYSFSQIYKRVTRLVGGNYDQRRNDLYIIKYWIRCTSNSIVYILGIILGIYPKNCLRGIKQRAQYTFVCLCVECIRNYERFRLLTMGKTRR